jgi:Zn-dependent oligopeptidase
MSPSFQHIFSGGYAAGYYSYKWAEVLEADVFSVFKEKGLFDRATADKLRRCILSKGGSRPPMDLFRDFRGREPDPDALLRRDGLL